MSYRRTDCQVPRILPQFWRWLATLILLSAQPTLAQRPGRYGAIYSGVPWFDQRGEVVSAHGANIVSDQGRFYLFGEAHTDTSNAFAGFNCYSSSDLYNWQFERVALPVQPAGKLGPGRVGERVKVMKCPKTGEYVMYMHVDTLGYKDQFVGYATAPTITGPYTFKGPILFNGKPVRKWDMGTFQDADGTGYVLTHGGEIYLLSKDYKRVSEQVNNSMTSGFESPALFRKGRLYYFLGSHLTSWEKNDNYYYTATSLRGPWTARGAFAPTGTLTWNSQTTFVLPLAGAIDTTYLFMGDRWSFPKQASAATYVWQPLIIAGPALAMPSYQEAWRINLSTGVAARGQVVENTYQGLITYTGKWRRETSDTLAVSSSDEKGATYSVKFNGTQISLVGLARPTGGYARVVLRNNQGKAVCSSLIDLYCKYPVATCTFQSPVLPKDTYTLTVAVLGERPNWSDKRKSDYGSTGYVVSLGKVLVGK
ncbi:family 43 glycosylhydrolase [Hymenobacter sp. HMF4947]|uniref:Family 43 glycosylhydrolase n=1 Tax=Hymenobacter ginkgonis TaxID=2682976 RepID=A0A7K1TGM5_9BACT|nr:family 43 glycosylhydrolase [Hymenobacter ginkgonis]MVN77558.1 family 43 glycosylhydrolase [Hymenobacter ginkgonis]